ncbi:hypothetical protein AB0M95_00065 [Sphaerisporangium sp. NPDC051017]|uniref:hypothetical protein n=1 Tax=Sphaerisporangium sp. NPDC051017 TaxID=3154636 RepID=UPI00341498B3
MALLEGRHQNGAADRTPAVHAAQVDHPAADRLFAVARIAIGWLFLWAFLDKLFGWGFATPTAKAWIHGGSPTTGFLKGTAENTFGAAFSGLAGQPWVDWLFMTGLLGIGVALILGAGMRIAAVAGGLLLVLMWAAELPLATNPFLDEHLVYIIVIAALALADAGRTWGIGGWWGETTLVKRLPILK